MILSDQIEVASAAHFLKEAEDNPICVYYADFNELKTTSLLSSMYAEFTDVFDEKAEDVLPPHWGELNHHIDLLLSTSSPFRPLYNLSEEKLQVLKNYIDKHLHSEFITRFKSSAASSILFMKKKDDSLHLCVNYRGLNAISIKNKYSISLISEILNRLSWAQIFMKLNLWEAYNLIWIWEEDEWKTAFWTQYGSFKFKVMPFSLMNAPATFQSYIDRSLQGLLNEFVIIYLDDILIYSESEENHQKHIEQVLHQLRESRLFVKLKKCIFHVSQVKYLSYIISPQGISMNSAWVNTVKSWSTLRSVKDVQSFLGFCNFYCRFIKEYSRIAHALTELIKKATPFQWGEEAALSFEMLKTAFLNALLLAQFNSEEYIFMKTDVSDFTVSDILSQWGTDTHWHPVAFFSCKLQPAECNYDTPDQELLVIVTSFWAWRHYLKGVKHPVKVFTDHNNLQYFLSTKPLIWWQAHWAEFLSGFDFEIEYRAEFKNPADSSSWRPDYQPTGSDDYTLVPFFKLTVMSLCLTEVSNEEGPEGDALLSHIIVDDICCSLKERDFTEINEANHGLKWKEGLLYLSDQLYIPDDDALQLHILWAFHDSWTAEHLDRDKTLAALHQWFHWPDMAPLIVQYVKSCDLCERIKSVKHLPYGELSSLPVSGSPWTHITIDFITDLLRSTDFIDNWQYNAVLIIVNHFSKMMHYMLMMKDIDSVQFTWLLLHEVIHLHHISMMIISDWGTLFQSEFWRTLTRLLGTDHWLFTAFHSQTDGQTEWQNQTLKHYLWCYVNYLQDDWVQQLPLAEHVYNSTVYSVTKVSPFFTCIGWESVPFQLHLLQLKKINLAAAEMIKKIHRLQEQLVIQISEAQDQQMKYYDVEHAWQTFEERDKVWLKGVHLCTDRLSKKLDHHHLGPFSVLKKISDQAYQLSLPDIMKVHPVFHVSLLESYHVNELSDRVQAPLSAVIIITEEGEAEEYEVEAILRTWLFYENLQYLIWWKGYTGPEAVQWCSPEDVINAEELVNQFHQKHPDMPQWGTRKTHSQKWSSLHLLSIC